jgi:hypothetical protein
MIGYLWQEYESIFEGGSGAMTVIRVKINKHIGKTLDYSVLGQVKITMLDYINEILAAFDRAEPKGGGTKTSSAPDSLFKVDKDYDKLAQSKAVEFHNLVAKTVYATMRARPDTCIAIAFLTTRVREPDKDDWTKLVHMMRYIRGTRTMPLILSASGSGIFEVVGGHIVRCTPTHVRSLGRRTVARTWISNREFHETEDQHSEFYGDRDLRR